MPARSKTAGRFRRRWTRDRAGSPSQTMMTKSFPVHRTWPRWQSPSLFAEALLVVHYNCVIFLHGQQTSGATKRAHHIVEHPASRGCTCTPYPTLPYYTLPYPWTAKLRCYDGVCIIEIQRSAAAGARAAARERAAARAAHQQLRVPGGARARGGVDPHPGAPRMRHRQDPSLNSRDAGSHSTSRTRGHGYLSRRTLCELQQLSTPHYGNRRTI